MLSPKIETERLILRRYKETDIDAIYDIITDKRLTQYIKYPDKTKEEELECIKKWIIEADESKYERWVIELKTTREEVGNIAAEELGISLPDSLLEKLQGQMAGTAGEILEQSGVYDGIAETLTQFIIKGIAFFIALIIAAILSGVIRCLLGFISEILVIHGVNRGLGTAAGALYGFIFVWIGMYFVALCCTSEVGRLLYSYIQESLVLTALYENNPIYLLF